jgi:hypothetical protein
MAVKRTAVIKNPGGIQVDPRKRQFLHFTLKTKGPVPIFTFASNIKGLLFSAPDFEDHPTTIYEFDHLKSLSDAQQLELLDLTLTFLSCPAYDYLVELRDKNDQVLKRVMHIKYTGTGTDITSESVRVILPED